MIDMNSLSVLCLLRHCTITVHHLQTQNQPPVCSHGINYTKLRLIREIIILASKLNGWHMRVTNNPALSGLPVTILQFLQNIIYPFAQITSQRCAHYLKYL